MQDLIKPLQAYKDFFENIWDDYPEIAEDYIEGYESVINQLHDLGVHDANYLDRIRDYQSELPWDSPCPDEQRDWMLDR